MGDELFVCELLDEMEGVPNWNKAKAIVKGLRKRMKERHLEIQRRVAERKTEGTAEVGNTQSPSSRLKTIRRPA
jgi:hypothetical protein